MPALGTRTSKQRFPDSGIVALKIGSAKEVDVRKILLLDESVFLSVEVLGLCVELNHFGALTKSRRLVGFSFKESLTVTVSNQSVSTQLINHDLLFCPGSPERETYGLEPPIPQAPASSRSPPPQNAPVS